MIGVFSRAGLPPGESTLDLGMPGLRCSTLSASFRSTIPVCTGTRRSQEGLPKSDLIEIECPLHLSSIRTGKLTRTCWDPPL
jgi:hypothetical protein